MINYQIDEFYARKTGHGSLGMTNKYFKDNYWYKQNLKGYEGLSEEICSILCIKIHDNMIAAVSKTIPLLLYKGGF